MYLFLNHFLALFSVLKCGLPNSVTFFSESKCPCRITHIMKRVSYVSASISLTVIPCLYSASSTCFRYLIFLVCGGPPQRFDLCSVSQNQLDLSSILLLKQTVSHSIRISSYPIALSFILREVRILMPTFCQFFSFLKEGMFFVFHFFPSKLHLKD